MTSWRAKIFPPKHTSIKQALDGKKECSFFLHVSFPGPHPPFLVTAGMRAAMKDNRTWPDALDNPEHVTPGGLCTSSGEPSETRDRCNYAAEIENLDALFKRNLDEVEAQGEMHRTIVFVSSDHGEMLGVRALSSRDKR